MQASPHAPEPVAAPGAPPANSPGFGIEEVSQGLDPEWEEAFNWRYGPRLWNVGCG